MQSEPAKTLDDLRDGGRVRNRRERIRSPRRFGWIDSRLATHLIKLLRSLVVRLERLVVDRPRGRHAIDVLDRLKIFAAQPVQHAAPELGISPNAVVRVWLKFAAVPVEP